MQQHFLATLHRLVVDEQGIQHVEEALLLALIAVAAIAVTNQLGSAVIGVFTEACDEMTAVAGCPAVP